MVMVKRDLPVETAMKANGWTMPWKGRVHFITPEETYTAVNGSEARFPVMEHGCVLCIGWFSYVPKDKEYDLITHETIALWWCFFCCLLNEGAMTIFCTVSREHIVHRESNCTS